MGEKHDPVRFWLLACRRQVSWARAGIAAPNLPLHELDQQIHVVSIRARVRPMCWCPTVNLRSIGRSVRTRNDRSRTGGGSAPWRGAGRPSLSVQVLFDVAIALSGRGFRSKSLLNPTTFGSNRTPPFAASHPRSHVTPRRPLDAPKRTTDVVTP